MSWTDYRPPVAMVETSDGVSRPVRGLSLDDFAALIPNNIDALLSVTTLYLEQQKDIYNMGSITELLIIAAREFPSLISEVISIVTDTPQLKDVRLGSALQLKILQASFKLTIEDAGGLGNLSAMLQQTLAGLAASRGEVSQRLQATLSPYFTTGAEKTRTS